MCNILGGKNNADIVALLDKLDAEKFLKDKYYAEVEVYVNDIISELQLQAKLLLSNKEDYSKRIEELKREKENALNSLREKATRRSHCKVQPMTFSWMCVWH